jgi:hypothetical protein
MACIRPEIEKSMLSLIKILSSKFLTEIDKTPKAACSL